MSGEEWEIVEHADIPVSSSGDYEHDDLRASWEAQSNHDKHLISQSLDPDHPYNSLEKRQALARLLFLIHYASPEFLLTNGALVRVYGHAPTESLLCHTQRVVISMLDAETSCRVVNWLMTGEDAAEDSLTFFRRQIEVGKLSRDRNGQGAITYFNRRAGTHDLVTTDSLDCPVLEEKSLLHGTGSAMKSLNPDCITNHWGMNIGIGINGKDDGCFGHVYFNIKKLGEKYALQVGIEPSAPLKKGPANQAHGMSGRASDTAITGGKRLDEYPDLECYLRGKLPRRNALFARNISETRFNAILEEFGKLDDPVDCLGALANSPHIREEFLSPPCHETFHEAWVKGQLKSVSLSFDEAIEAKLTSLKTSEDFRESLNKMLTLAGDSLLEDSSNAQDIIAELTGAILTLIKAHISTKYQRSAEHHLIPLLIARFQSQHGVGDRSLAVSEHGVFGASSSRGAESSKEALARRVEALKNGLDKAFF